MAIVDDPFVSIVLSTYNKWEALRRTLWSIFVQAVPFPYEVIVVDDGSTDYTAQVCGMYRGEGHPLQYVRTERLEYTNPGPARNLGYKRARAPILIAQSDEVEHHIRPTAEGTIATLARLLEPKTAVIAHVINVRNGRPAEDYSGPQCQRPLFFLGAVWREDVYAIGGNDEEFVYPGYEDVWFATCLERRGVQFVYTNAVVGYHHDHPRPPSSVHPLSGKLYEHKHAEAVRTGVWTAASGPWEMA